MTDTSVKERTYVESADQEEGNAGHVFAELLDSYDYQRPHRGQIIEGVILEASDDELVLDVGLKRDAFVTSKDLDRLEDAILDNLEPGAEAIVYVLQPRNADGNLIVSINKALEHEDWKRAEEMMDDDEMARLEVVDANKGGLLVEFGRLRGFVPDSHIVDIPRGTSRERRLELKAEMRGQTILCKVIEVNYRRNRLILSQRAAMQEYRHERLEELEEGQIVTGRVVNLVKFGAFVNLGGIDGLIHISEMAWHRVDSPDEVLSVGDEIEVYVKKVDRERERIGLSLREVPPTPWDSVEETYDVGQLVECTVTNVVDFGAFARLPCGLEGLIHISQMSSYKPSKPGDLLHTGDEVLVRIASLDAERRRVGLSLDRVKVEEQMEWMRQRVEAPGTPQADAPSDEVETAIEEVKALTEEA